MTSVEPPGAEGGGVNSRTQLYTGSDEEGEEDSSILADLASMFPVVAHDELVTVLRSHHGDVDATVDYLMALSLQRDSGGASLPPDFLQEGFVEEDERQFSSEIGGLPEVLPSFMTGGQTDSESDDEIEEDAPANRVRSGSRHVNSDEDPLPSYEEAVMDEGYIVAGSIMLPTTTSREMLIEGQSSGSSCLPHPHAQKKKSKHLVFSEENVLMLILQGSRS